MALWEQIKQKHENRKQNVATDNSNNTMLYNLLTNDKVNTQQNSSGNLSEGLSNIAKAAKTFGQTFGSNNPSSVPSQYQFGNLGKHLFGDYDLGGSNAGAGSFGSFLSNKDAASAAGSAGTSFLGKAAPYSGLIGGAINAGTEAIKGGNWGEDVPQAFFGVDSEKDSDVMQALKGAGKGATMGMAFGPIGAIVGGVLGLGSSFLDDI